MSIKDAMKELGEKDLQCPCCSGKVSPTSLKTLDKQIGSLENSGAIWWAPNAKTILQNIKKFQWACDTCLNSGKAILAHPDKQTFCDHAPFLAYFDHSKLCSTCNQLFLFSAKEQEFWYETLHFWVQSEAKNCPACRKKARSQKKQKD